MNKHAIGQNQNIDVTLFIPFQSPPYQVLVEASATCAEVGSLGGMEEAGETLHDPSSSGGRAM